MKRRARGSSPIAAPRTPAAAPHTPPAAPRTPAATGPRHPARGNLTGLGLCIGALAIAALVLQARTYLPFIADDALISLRYAERLLHGHGLTWNDGERVEGYSNLLWVLLCAALGRAGIDLVAAARLLGFAGSAAAIAAVAWAFPTVAAGGALPAAAGALALALASPVAVWTIGGLESPLVAGLLAWSVALALELLRDGATRRDAFAPSLLLGLLCVTRPDGFVLAFAVCGALLAARGVSKPALGLVAALAAGPVICSAGQLAFRLAYYGDWIANSARVKLAFSATHVRSGALYVIDGLVAFAPLLIGVIAALAAGRGGEAPARRAQGGPDGAMERPRRVRFLLVPLAAWTAVVILVGGDPFPARRFFVPLAVLFAFLAAEALRTLLEHRRKPSVVFVAGVALALAAFAALQLADPAAGRARLERWEWDGEVIGRFLHRAFADRAPRIAVDPAGCVPYWSELPAIDMLGLNDRWLAHHPPPGFGSGRMGHELGNGRYVLSRAPDMVLLCVPTGSDTGCFLSGKQLVAEPTFRSRYALVTYEGDEPRRVQSRIWTRREGGVLGIGRAPDRVSVPGWQLASNPASVTRLDPAGRPAVLATREAPALLLGLTLPAGRWRLSVESETPGVRVEVRASGSAQVLGSGTDTFEFTLSGGAVDVGVSPVAGEAFVRALELVRGR